MISLNISDKFNSERGLKYTLDNGRINEQRIWAILDRFYTFDAHPLNAAAPIQT